MSRLQMLRELVAQRVTAAAEEISGLFERTIAEYEEEICQVKETERQRKLLETVFNPTVQLHRTVVLTDVQQLLVVKEEVPPEWSPNLDQDDQQLLQMKEEQEDLWTSQEAEQLDGLQEADLISFPSTTVPVKSQDPDTQHHSQTKTNENVSDSSETELSYEDWQEPLSDCGAEIEDSDGWTETRPPESGVDALKCEEAPVSDVGCNSKRFTHGVNLKTHNRVHTRNERFGCDVCGKRFSQHGTLNLHTRVHTGERPFGCDVCGKRFKQYGALNSHTRVHTGERPFGCDVCGKRFKQHGHLHKHTRVHTGERPFGCDVCGKRFTDRGYLKQHTRVHTG